MPKHKVQKQKSVRIVRKKDGKIVARAKKKEKRKVKVKKKPRNKRAPKRKNMA